MMMLVAEKPLYKALYFDLRIEKLTEYYSQSHPKGAYSRIKEFLLKNDFSHEQYSGYHSNKPLTDLIIIDLIDNMKAKLPWLEECVSKFEVTNISENYNVLNLFPNLKVTTRKM